MKRLLCWFMLAGGLLSGCKTGSSAPTESAGTDLPQLYESGELKAVTLYSSTSYFEYRQEPMGYEYDLVKDFAASQGLNLTILVAENTSRLIEMLDSGEADLIAYPMQIDNQLKQEYIYCGPEEISNQVLVQRADKGDTVLTDVTQLIGREVYVQPESRYHQRLRNLDDELGGGILIRTIERDSLTTEDLIEMVSRGEIPYTISDDKTARLNKTYHWNISINLEISFPQRSAWMVRNDSPLLAAAIDEWSADRKGRDAFTSITKRYFERSKLPDGGQILPTAKGSISPFDHLFKKHATKLGWDWQLIAAIAYQESKFDLFVVSWAGAQGLMGIMPNTARGLGVSPHELEDPDIAIQTGVECLRRFGAGFSDVADPTERIKLTLASYNAGIGHIYDAQRLAQKHGKDPHIWDNHVAEFIRLKNDPKYYNDPVCRHGYLRGKETFNYVDEVMTRYHQYLLQTT